MGQASASRKAWGNDMTIGDGAKQYCVGTIEPIQNCIWYFV